MKYSMRMTSNIHLKEFASSNKLEFKAKPSNKLALLANDRVTDKKQNLFGMRSRNKWKNYLLRNTSQTSDTIF